MAESASLQTYNLEYLDLNNHRNAVLIDKKPDTCPVCGKGVQVQFITAHGKKPDYDKGHYVQVVFKCPRIECQALFTAYYTSPSWYRGSRTYDERVYLQKTFIRPYFADEDFDDEIKSLSLKFVDIFSQASIAESMALIDICGAGYRKALEFLIKDYLCLIKSDKKESIINSSLGSLIHNEVDDEKIKKLAGLAKDIGNDETHYDKRLEKLSLEDMKKLIKLTIHWISASLLTDEYSEIYDQLISKKE